MQAFEQSRALMNAANHSKVYATNNRYAYLWDRYQVTRSPEDLKLAQAEIKVGERLGFFFFFPNLTKSDVQLCTNL